MFFILIIRWNAIIYFGIWLRWPKLVAFRPSVFLSLASAHDHRHILLHYHLPKVICRLGQRSLTRYDFFVSEIRPIAFFEWGIDKARIYVVWFRYLFDILTSNQLYPALVIRQNIRVPIPLLINAILIHEQLIDDLLRIIKKFVEHIIFLVNLCLAQRTFSLRKEIRNF